MDSLHRLILINHSLVFVVCHTTASKDKVTIAVRIQWLKSIGIPEFVPIDDCV